MTPSLILYFHNIKYKYIKYEYIKKTSMEKQYVQFLKDRWYYSILARWLDWPNKKTNTDGKGVERR